MRARKVLGILALVFLLAMTPVSGSEIYAVDANHDLATDAQTEQFQNEGVATGQADDLNMTLTMAEDCADVGHDPMVSPPQKCLRVQYNEDVARTVRVYIPRAYFTPFENQQMESVDGQTSAEMEPINNREYAAVTIHMDGETDSVFTISTVQSTLWDYRQRSYRTINGSINVDIPRPAGSDNNPWQYLDSSQFAGGETVTVDSPDASVQYDADPADNQTSWVPAPKCDDRSDAPVCTLDRTNEVIIVPEDNNETIPTVRYKDEASAVDNVAAGAREVREIASNYVDRIQSAMGEISG